MGIITVEHGANLFWLGRYVERIFTTLYIFFEHYDIMLDKDENCYRSFLEKLGVEDKYGNRENFISGFLYKDGVKTEDGFAIISAFDRAYDNAMLIRDIIGSESLAYIHLAADAFRFSRDASNLRLALMPAIDYLLAFWGSIDNSSASGDAGVIVKCGKSVERIDLYVRFARSRELICAEYEKLRHIADMNENCKEFMREELKRLDRMFEGCVI